MKLLWEKASTKISAYIEKTLGNLIKTRKDRAASGGERMGAALQKR
jgi:hypothetical protein